MSSQGCNNMSTRQIHIKKVNVLVSGRKDNHGSSSKRPCPSAQRFKRQANSFVNNLQEELTKLAPVIAEKIKEAQSIAGSQCGWT